MPEDAKKNKEKKKRENGEGNEKGKQKENGKGKGNDKVVSKEQNLMVKVVSERNCLVLAAAAAAAAAEAGVVTMLMPCTDGVRVLEISL